MTTNRIASKTTSQRTSKTTSNRKSKMTSKTKSKTTSKIKSKTSSKMTSKTTSKTTSEVTTKQQTAGLLKSHQYKEGELSFNSESFKINEVNWLRGIPPGYANDQKKILKVGDSSKI